MINNFQLKYFKSITIYLILLFGKDPSDLSLFSLCGTAGAHASGKSKVLL